MILRAYLAIAALNDVGYRLYNADDSPAAARVTAGIVEYQPKRYRADVEFDELAFDGYIVWDSPSRGIRAEEELKPERAKQSTLEAIAVDTAATKAQVASLGSASVVVRSPVLPGGKTRIIAGDDYYLADGHALGYDLLGLDFDSINQIVFIVDSPDVLSVVTSISEIDGGVHVDVELSAAQTAPLGDGSRTNNRTYYLRVTSTNGHEFDRIDGPLEVGAGSITGN